MANTRSQSRRDSNSPTSSSGPASPIATLSPSAASHGVRKRRKKASSPSSPAAAPSLFTTFYANPTDEQRAQLLRSPPARAASTAVPVPTSPHGFLSVRGTHGSSRPPAAQHGQCSLARAVAMKRRLHQAAIEGYAAPFSAIAQLAGINCVHGVRVTMSPAHADEFVVTAVPGNGELLRDMVSATVRAATSIDGFEMELQSPSRPFSPPPMMHEGTRAQTDHARERTATITTMQPFPRHSSAWSASAVGPVAQTAVMGPPPARPGSRTTSDMGPPPIPARIAMAMAASAPASGVSVSSSPAIPAETSRSVVRETHSSPAADTFSPAPLPASPTAAANAPSPDTRPPIAERSTSKLTPDPHDSKPGTSRSQTPPPPPDPSPRRPATPPTGYLSAHEKATRQLLILQAQAAIEAQEDKLRVQCRALQQLLRTPAACAAHAPAVHHILDWLHVHVVAALRRVRASVPPMPTAARAVFERKMRDVAAFGHGGGGITALGRIAAEEMDRLWTALQTGKPGDASKVPMETVLLEGRRKPLDVASSLTSLGFPPITKPLTADKPAAECLLVSADCGNAQVQVQNVYQQQHQSHCNSRGEYHQYAGRDMHTETQVPEPTAHKGGASCSSPELQQSSSPITSPAPHSSPWSFSSSSSSSSSPSSSSSSLPSVSCSTISSSLSSVASGAADYHSSLVQSAAAAMSTRRTGGYRAVWAQVVQTHSHSHSHSQHHHENLSESGHTMAVKTSAPLLHDAVSGSAPVRVAAALCPSQASSHTATATATHVNGAGAFYPAAHGARDGVADVHVSSAAAASARAVEWAAWRDYQGQYQHGYDAQQQQQQQQAVSSDCAPSAWTYQNTSDWPQSHTGWNGQQHQNQHQHQHQQQDFYAGHHESDGITRLADLGISWGVPVPVPLSVNMSVPVTVGSVGSMYPSWMEEDDYETLQEYAGN